MSETKQVNPSTSRIGFPSLPSSGFSRNFEELPIDEWLDFSAATRPEAVDAILARGRTHSPNDFAALLSDAAGSKLEAMAALSQHISVRNFGRVMRLFAPLYLSNECINICKYCGFSRNNSIPRITIPVEQVVAETKKLAAQGFRSLLLVAGEHPKYVSNGYVEDCVRRCLDIMPEVALELGPMETQDYIPMVRAGAEGLIVYQETYHAPTYSELHVAGPKKHFHWRMDTPERGYAAGFRRLGVGALFGLYDWRYEALCLAAHLRYLLKHCWKARISVSLPRMRPAAGGFQADPRYFLHDRQFVQLITALRISFPTVGITLSTREPAALRDNLMPLGVTLMSAGSSTEPGGYSQFDESAWLPTSKQEGEQFHIADERPPGAVARSIASHGYEPVWKDSDQSLVREG